MTERRKALRTSLHPARIGDDTGAILCGCTISDISERGARIAMEVVTDLPNDFTLLLTQSGTIQRRCRVLWRSGHEVGVEFTAISHNEYFLDCRDSNIGDAAVSDRNYSSRNHS